MDKATLLLARILSATAYTGLVLALPPVLAVRYWEKVAEVSADIIGAALALWIDEVEEIEELFTA